MRLARQCQHRFTDDDELPLQSSRAHLEYYQRLAYNRSNQFTRSEFETDSAIT